MQPTYGPNSVQCERFLELVAGLTADQWRDLERVRMGAIYKGWVAAAHGIDEPDPWPAAMERAASRWDETESEVMLAAMGSLMDAVITAAPPRLPEATRCLEVARQAASAVVTRPWMGEDLFEELYGVMATAIAIEALGHPVALRTRFPVATRPAGTSLPPRQPPTGLPRDLCQAGDVEIRERGTHRITVRREGAATVSWEVSGASDEPADPPDHPDVMEYVLVDRVPRLVHLTVGRCALILRGDDRFAMRPAT